MYLPIIVLWFIWKAQNQSFFEDHTLMPSQVSSFSLGLLRSFPQDNYVVKIRPVFVESIDKSYPWGYFDGSAAGEPKNCGAGGLLYISDEHYFSFKVGLWVGTNNSAKLCALELLLTLDRKNNIAKIHIFGDFRLVINWASGKYRMQNLELSQVLQEVNRLSYMFEPH